MLLVIALVVMILGFNSCSVIFQSMDGNLGYFPQATGNPVGSFSESGELWYIISPMLMNLNDTNLKLDTLIRTGLAPYKADFAKDLKIIEGFTVMDFVISYFVPVIGRETITVEGEAYQQ
jgi:hypothetical protein